MFFFILKTLFLVHARSYRGMGVSPLLASHKPYPDRNENKGSRKEKHAHGDGTRGDGGLFERDPSPVSYPFQEFPARPVSHRAARQ